MAGFRDLPIRFILGLLGIIFAVAFYPVLTQVMGSFMQSDNANCPNYVDIYNGGMFSWNSTMPTLGTAGSCLLAPIFAGLVMLLVMIAFIYYVVWGDSSSPTDTQQYQ